jgi:EAL domain-containing protein (putative c-di-GMP-specific phosphodiesterase class I)
MDGIGLLDGVRARDLDVPVIFITGRPSVETAIKAIEQGALRYLVKPIDPPTLIKVAADAVRLHAIARAKRDVLKLAGGLDRLVGDHAGLVVRFANALECLHIAYQPIISWSGRCVFAYEALLRSTESSLPHPSAMLDAAERLGRILELGRKIRMRAVEPLDGLDDYILLFLNLHPEDLLDPALTFEDTPLAPFARRVVLEITERASLQKIPDVQSRIGSLRDLGFRIAIDDLGAGYAGLNSFALLQPDVVKLDMDLVRNLHREPTKRTLVRTMIRMCKELGITVVGEGIETPEERDELIEAGCDLMQGFLFAHPGNPLPQPRF